MLFARNYTFAPGPHRTCPEQFGLEQFAPAQKAPLMQRHLTAFLFLLLLAASCSDVAEDPVTVSGAWARATAPGQTVAAVYLTISSRVGARLVAISTPVAGSAELHQMKMDDSGTMRMRRLESLDLPRGQAVTLGPGGSHIMLFNLTQPVAAGNQIPLQLTVVDAAGRRSVLNVQAQVRPLGAATEN